MESSVKFEHDGTSYVLEVYEERDDDCRKFWYDITDLETRHVYCLDWSPYVLPEIEDIKLWLELGKPRRITIGPLTREDLEEIKCCQKILN